MIQKTNKLFGTNGIRGIFAQDFTLEFVHDIIASFCMYMDKKGVESRIGEVGGERKENSKGVLVGYDGRHSSPVIARMVCATLNSRGVSCKDAGLVPTPCLEYATKKLGYVAGVMVTASHNPPEYNGVKFCAADGVEISREDEKVIEDIYFNQKWVCSNDDGDDVGNAAATSKITQIRFGETVRELDACHVYTENILSQIDHQKIKSNKFTIVLDLGNGAQSVVAPDFCKSLGCNTIVINEDIDGSFPGRGSEPTPQNLSELSKTVTKNCADFGIAFDGDGDRSVFCDDVGKVMTGDTSALLLVHHILTMHPGSKVVTCLNSSNSIETIAKEFGSEVIRTKVGSVEVSRRMVQDNAILGFEENGGFMFGLHNEVRDGVMTLGLMLDLLASARTVDDSTTTSPSISNLSACRIPRSFTTKDKIPCSVAQASQVMDYFMQKYPSADTTDGIKISLGGGGAGSSSNGDNNNQNSKKRIEKSDTNAWVMIRPSGTEPIIRVYAEAQSQEELEQIINEYTQKIRAYIHHE